MGAGQRRRPALCRLGTPENPRELRVEYGRLPQETNKPDLLERLKRGLLRGLRDNREAYYEEPRSSGWRWTAFPLKGPTRLLGAVLLETREPCNEENRRTMLLTWCAILAESVKDSWPDPWIRVDPNRWTRTLQGRDLREITRGLLEDIEAEQKLECIVSTFDERSARFLCDDRVSPGLKDLLQPPGRWMAAGFREGDDGLVPEIARSGKPLDIPNLRTDPRPLRDPRLTDALSFASPPATGVLPLAFAGFPVRDATGRVRLVLELFRERLAASDPWRFTHEEVEAVRRFLARLTPLLGDLIAVGSLLQGEQRNAVTRGSDSARIVYGSESMRKALAWGERVARTEAPVLITGERGTGKELLAHFIHRNSNRRRRKLEVVNSALLRDDLAQSELFGHEKGAFTGADRKKDGSFVIADGGTIFLDEIGTLSHGAQPMLLRALQSGEIKPMGAKDLIRVDVRVIAATNSDLEKQSEQGEFRADLFDRIKLRVALPPLAQRREDIPPLIRYFCETEDWFHWLERAAYDALMDYAWPGNVRELHNALLEADTRAEDDRRVLRFRDLPDKIRKTGAAKTGAKGSPAAARPAARPETGAGESVKLRARQIKGHPASQRLDNGRTVGEEKKTLAREAVAETVSRKEAAALLEIHESNLSRWLTGK